MNLLANISAQLGIPLLLFTVILVWSFVWKLLALWKSARNNSVVWFIVMALINTAGILEILYIFVFSKMKPCKPVRTKSKKAIKKTTKRKKR